MKKQLILITSPPACGKTRLARKLAETFYGSVYLDKDSVIPLSRQIFTVARKPYNRSSQFFNKEIRDYEYKAILAIAAEAIRYNDRVILNAPFTKEIRDAKYISELRDRFERRGAELIVVWIKSDRDACYRNMKRRNSDRDKWKLKNWSKYIEGVNFDTPTSIGDNLYVYDGRDKDKSAEEFDGLLKRLSLDSGGDALEGSTVEKNRFE